METRKVYFQYLDALRCLAFIAVFYAHTGTIFAGATVTHNFPLNIWMKFTVYGSYGVNFFFVLSGFLITYLLLKERTETGSISIKNFYIRRILRIWPVYFMTFFIGVCVLPFLISSDVYNVFIMTNPIMSLQTITYYFFFLGNFYQGLGFGIASLSIGILWSVCVEEQFYLVWPWIVRQFSTRRLMLVTALLISLSLLYKYIWADDRLGNYYLPWSVGMDLGFGALLGMYYFENKKREVVKHAFTIAAASLLLIAATVGIGYTGHASIKSNLIEVLRLVKTPLIDCLFILILIFFIQKTAAIKTDNSHPLIKFFHLSKGKIGGALIYLGKISYGLYAYHTICLMLVVTTFYRSGFLKVNVTRPMFFVTVISAFLLAVGVAHLSSTYLERPITALKRKMK